MLLPSDSRVALVVEERARRVDGHGDVDGLGAGELVLAADGLVDLVRVELQQLQVPHYQLAHCCLRWKHTTKLSRLLLT